ncbi:MAG: Undecaprenyl-phosphate galactosephosphotransferase [Actinomycetia bacterium]|nr:Undecaprenyl-phosphate galactosephosphotransferase [Actinomycetes bacterium]
MTGITDAQAERPIPSFEAAPPAPVDGERIVGHRGKRVLDLTLAVLALLVLLPLLLLTALVIFLEDRGPVLYRQQRVGFRGREFSIFKFRSMVRDADRKLGELQERNMTDGLLFKIHRDPRVTRVGRLIRRTSIDELPQLLNVVRGQMSLVGPRPLPVSPDDFDVADDRRHEVRPGITGFWQVSGGPALGYRDMIDLDLTYIRNWSLTLDLRIIARTVPALLARTDC